MTKEAAKTEFELDADQVDALYMFCYARCAVITGGPGRGKTWALRAAVGQLGSVALCAPSGKAARRMAELTGCEAMTVHRLLGLRPESPQGVFHAGNPLPYDVVIVDEASTLDNALAAMLLGACDVNRTRVIFVGDVDQLPSVGAGQVLHDLIESGVVPVVRLKTMHRAAAESWVCRNAPLILEGKINLQDADDFEMVDADEDLVERTVEVAQQLVEEKGGRDAVQVVVPMNVGDYGAQVLNPALQKAFNPKPDHLPHLRTGGADMFEGDSVVCIKNDYDRAVFNGETGRVVEIGYGAGDPVTVDFVDRIVQYPDRASAQEHLRLSYALSVHKMQGSECDWVVLALHEQHGPLLSRKLLYTAVTRAKKGVVIVGQRSAVRRACQLADTTARVTLLRSRIQKQVRATIGG
jgi:exodeoxyribonuclease V alpha subunit